MQAGSHSLSMVACLSSATVAIGQVEGVKRVRYCSMNSACRNERWNVSGTDYAYLGEVGQWIASTFLDVFWSRTMTWG